MSAEVGYGKPPQTTRFRKVCLPAPHDRVDVARSIQLLMAFTERQQLLGKDGKPLTIVELLSARAAARFKKFR
jgi:hypothetical protein